MKKIIIVLSVCVTVMNNCFAQLQATLQDKQSAEEYIAKYKDLAIREMERMGVPAAISLAQGLLETENGNSVLFKESNNHFGIKCKSTWTAAGVSHDDDAKGECFRSYKDAEASYRDHSNFLRGSDRYAPLFRLDPLDYKGWAYGLKTAGYATNPRYPEILIKNIEQYNLQQYSIEGAGGVPKYSANEYQDDPNVNVNIDTTANNTLDTQTSTRNVPLNTLTINGSKCIYEEKGTSLLAIATKNNIDLDKLLEFNDMVNDGILNKSQLIFLQKKSKTGDMAFYVTQQEATPYEVAQETGIQLQSLLDYNQLNPDDKISAGTKLYLQPHAIINTTTVDTALNNPTKYSVQPKDGLYSISKKYGVSVQQLKDWNHLQSDSLSIGQQLIVGQ